MNPNTGKPPGLRVIDVQPINVKFVKIVSNASQSNY